MKFQRRKGDSKLRKKRARIHFFSILKPPIILCLTHIRIPFSSLQRGPGDFLGGKTLKHHRFVVRSSLMHRKKICWYSGTLSGTHEIPAANPDVHWDSTCFSPFSRLVLQRPSGRYRWRLHLAGRGSTWINPDLLQISGWWKLNSKSPYPLVNIQKLWNITILKFGKSTIVIVMFNSKLLNYQRATMGNIDGYNGISIHVIFVQTQVAGS